MLTLIAVLITVELLVLAGIFLYSSLEEESVSGEAEAAQMQAADPGNTGMATAAPTPAAVPLPTAAPIPTQVPLPAASPIPSAAEETMTEESAAYAEESFEGEGCRERPPRPKPSAAGVLHHLLGGFR